MSQKLAPADQDMNSTATTTLPVYMEKDDAATLSGSSTRNIAPGKACQTHGPSQTPLLEAQVADPHTKATLQALSSALASATEEGACLKCVSETITQTLTTFMQDVRTAKKNGQWSRDERKAIKAEAKGLMKGMKHDLKHSWRGHHEETPRPVRRGFYWKR